MKTWQWLLGAGVAVGAVAIAAKPASAATPPAPPAGTPNLPLQSRPIQAGSLAVITAQAQLRALGQNVTVDGVFGQHSSTALDAFLAAHPASAAQTAAYASVPATTQKFYVLDDYIRAQAMQPPGVGPSGALPMQTTGAPKEVSPYHGGGMYLGPPSTTPPRAPSWKRGLAR